MVTSTLAAYLTELRYEDLPADVIARTKTLVRDALGIALYTSHGTPWGRMVSDYAQQETEQGVSTIIGTAAKSTASSTALANGTMILGFELEDTTPHAHSHIGPPTIAAALAVGEKIGSSGKEVLTAIVAGYEAMGRIGRAISATMIQSGFHPTANLGAFGAATAAAKLLRVNAEGMLNALGLASVQGGGTMQSLNEGAMARRLYGGRPAQSGVVAAELACRGFTGPHEALEGLQGFGVVYAGENVDWQETTADFGQRFEVMHTTFKPHASCQVFHAAIDAMTTLRTHHDLSPQDVEEIVGEIRFVSPAHTNPTPQTVMAAQYSLPYCLSAALHHGHVGPDEFTDAMLTDASILEMASRVRAEYPPDWEQLDVFPGRVSVRMKDGRLHRHMVPYPKGDPQNPLTTSELDEKFARLAGSILSDAQLAHLSSTCDQLETLPDLTPLTRQLAVSSSG